MKVFLSHSSSDKGLVEKVWAKLGPECTWLDKAEIDIGEIILEKINEGIKNATDFVIFWSKHSSKSAWVRLEINMAFIRYMEDQGCLLRVVVLDDTELPLYLQPFLYLDVRGSLDSLPDRLCNILRENQKVNTRRNSFVNRLDELKRIETLIDDSDIRIVTLFGINGIGKRALLKRATEIFFTNSNYIGIEVKPGLDMVALALELAAVAKKEVPHQFHSAEEIKVFLEMVIEQLHSDGFVIAFHDVQNWLEEDGSLGSELIFLFDMASHLEPLKSRPIYLTTTRFFDLPVNYKTFHQYVKIDGVGTDHLVTIINNWLEIQNGKREETDSLKSIARALYGYPFAARIAAGLIGKFGVDYLNNYPEEIVNLRVDIAKYLLGQVQLEAKIVQLIEAISIVDGPLLAEDLATALDFSDEEFRTAIEVAISAGLIRFEESHYVVHPLVQDYYFRSSYAREYFHELTRKLSIEAKKRLEQLDIGTPLHSKLLPCVFRLVALSGDFNGALSLRKDLFGYLGQVVKDLYDSRDYETAFKYAKHLLDYNPEDWATKIYLARCLIRLNKPTEAEPVLLEMNKIKPSDTRIMHVLGRLYMSKNQWENALEWFSKALILRSNYIPSLRDSAECYFQLKELDEAEGFVKRAKEIDSTNPFVLQVESKIYEKRNDYVSAYRVMLSALMQDRNNASFHHRLGRISELRGELNKAKEHYLQAIEIDNKFFESRLSLLSVKIDLKDYSNIVEELDELESLLQGRGKFILRNVKAKYLLAMDELDEAARLTDKNLRHEENPIDYCLRARIEIRRSDKQASGGYKALATQTLRVANEIVKNGLVIDSENRNLLELQEQIQNKIKGQDGLKIVR